MTLHFRPDPERDGETIPAYGDCDLCRGHGFYVGGDEYQPCVLCGPRFRREYGSFVEALAELPSDDELAAEAAADRVDWAAKL